MCAQTQKLLKGTSLLLLAFAVSSAEVQYKRYKTPSSEELKGMVTRGVEFLAKAQNENGSFGLGKEVGVTAATLHALLVSDPSFRSPENAVSRKAIAFLLKNVQPEGNISDPDGGYDNYKTSYSLMALAELKAEEYATLVKAAAAKKLIPDEKTSKFGRETVVQNAFKWMAKQQASEVSGFEKEKDPGYGGQGYGGVPIPDLSNSQFSMDAFYASGIRRGHPYYNRMEIFLNRTQNFPKVNDLTDKTKFPQMKNFQVQSDGGFGYAPGISKFEVDVNKEGKKFARSYASMTAAGIKSLLQIGASKDDSRVQAALGWFQRNYTLEINYGLELPDKPEKGRQALYYFYWTYARAMSLLGEPTLKLADGTTINWAGELAGKLKSLQKADGSWKNEQSRWHEADPYLVTSYSLVALQHCRKLLRK